MRASLTNMSTKSWEAAFSLRIRLMTNDALEALEPWVTARKTSAMPPRPMHSSSRKRPKRCPPSGGRSSTVPARRTL